MVWAQLLTIPLYGNAHLSQNIPVHFVLFCSRSPYGKRGLKSDGVLGSQPGEESLPLREAWIEIFVAPLVTENSIRVAPFTGSVD